MPRRELIKFHVHAAAIMWISSGRVNRCIPLLAELLLIPIPARTRVRQLFGFRLTSNVDLDRWLSLEDKNQLGETRIKKPCAAESFELLDKRVN